MRVVEYDDARRAVRDSAALTRELMASPELVDALFAFVDQIPGVAAADAASLTLRDAESMHTIASTDEDAMVADDLQYVLGEGPCLDVTRHEDHYAIDDVGSDPRWPRWGPRAAELGMSSVISIRLFTLNDVIGTLNIYSKNPRRYDEKHLAAAYALAARASKILTAITRDSHLHEAIESRTIIARAQAMLMERYGLDGDHAFELLNQLSQDNNVNLRTLAEGLTSTHRPSTTDEHV